MELGFAWNGDSMSNQVISNSLKEKAETEILKREMMNSSMTLPKLVSTIAGLLDSFDI